MDAAFTPPSDGQHLATVSHDGRFWEVYLEFADELRSPDTYRARLVFEAADPAEGEEPYRTGVIIIENSFEEANRKARELDNHQVVALLRSVLP